MPTSETRRTAGRHPRAATVAPVLALALLAPAAAHAAPAPADVGPAPADEALLPRMGATAATTADGTVWSPTATGFASVPTDEHPHGTTGGAGGETVVVRDAESLAEHAAADEPLTILVQGEITIGDGDMIEVASDKTIAGTAAGGEIVDGGLYLDHVENVVVRNLTFRDSFVAGDWDGKLDHNDNDGIRVDTSDHVWIDHNEFTRLGDGQVDIRKDSTAVTVSWNVFRDHNKTLGVGWTDNVVTTLTLHHNRFSNVHQRNASLDNVAAGHVYNNWLSGVSSYGINARGGAQVLVESSVFEHAHKPLIADDGGDVHQRDNLFRDVWDEAPAETGPTFEATDHYDYTADPVEDVTRLLTRHAGTTKTPTHERTGRRITVAQDGSGDYLSLHAAVGVASRAGHPVEIVVEPGNYREVVSVWPGSEGLTIRGATGDPADVVVTYDKPDIDWANLPTLTVFADGVTLRDLTLQNAYDGSAGPSLAYALRDAGEGTVLDDVVVRGDRATGDPR